MKESSILLFDGICNLCNSTVQFVIERDMLDKFKFGSLQSESGQALLKKFNLPVTDFESFVLIQGESYFLKSTAILRVMKELGGGWKLFYVFIVIPKPVRDFVYSLVAKTRYTIFGKRDTCMVPTPELNKKFIS